MKDIKYSKNVLKLQLITLVIMLFVLAASAQTTYKGKELKHESISTAFVVPGGYERNNIDAYSEWLIAHPLKEKAEVKYYNGNIKQNNFVYAAVFDYDIGTRDLHHCADAAIYLRATYNYSQGNLKKLEFTFTNGYKSHYEDYLKGATPTPVNAGRDIITKWGKSRKDSCKTFRKWLDLIWSYAGTYSIEKYDTKQVNYWDMQPGDVFVTGGFPGHAITVVDMAVNKNGHKIYMLAQSYMPAQEQHILLNPVTLDVWYSMDDMNYINTPEYVFEPSDLRRFIL
jgi:hypothetical protein